MSPASTVDLPPDLILTDARVLTMDPARPRAEAVALTAGRIAAVGDRAAIEALAGPRTTFIDAGGRTLLPGFVESHLHIFPGAAELSHLNLVAITGFEPVAAAIRDYAAANPDLPLVMAEGARHAVFGAEAPTRHDLDRILPDRPLALVGADHHTVWANTAALTAAGLLHGRHLPPGNEIVMAPDGTAHGELRESEAFGPVIALSGEIRVWLGLRTGGEPDPAPTPAERAFDRGLMRAGLAHLARHGITSFHNMDGNAYTCELLAEIEAAGELTARARVPFHFKTFMDLAALDRASELAARFQGPMVRSGFVKLFADGVLDGFTAVMLEDYADRPGWRGEPLFDPAHFDAAVAEADRRGLQVAVHAIGDGAVRSVLDAYAKARAANGPRDSRHRIEHIEVIHPADIPRLAGLGVTASMQPPHPPGTMGLPLEPTVDRIGRARWTHAYAWAALRDAGARIAFSSDWPVSDVNPLRGIHAARTRRPWADDLPDQRLTLMETLAAYTAGGAHAGFAETDTGRIAEGFHADLALLSSDIEATPEPEIDRLTVDLTISAGRVVHRAESFEG
jgi:hypothetical protein